MSNWQPLRYGVVNTMHIRVVLWLVLVGSFVTAAVYSPDNPFSLCQTQLSRGYCQE
jgi:hypothetical protein